MRHQAFAVSQFDSPTCSFNSKNTSISYVRASLLILLTHRNGEKAPRHLRLLLFADELRTRSRAQDEKHAQDRLPQTARSSVHLRKSPPARHVSIQLPP